jgi:uncharacterized lipoprotein YmbA
MKIPQFLVAAALCVTAAGCFSPHTVATRHFILSPAPSATAASSGIRVGVGVVKMPAYLTGNSLAVRKDAGEIIYLESALWAERLDNGFARVLAADLSAKIPTDQVRLGAWRADAVTVEVHVTVEQFDVNQAGQGTLVAWWRITAPGGAKVLKSGEARLTRAGKSPASDSQNIVTTLSELTAEFSGTLAQAIREVTPSN